MSADSQIGGGLNNLAAAPMIDPYGRSISYLRVSVTDRCDFRCVYCMAENMAFLPKQDLLTLEELDRVCSVFIAKGVRKLRLTGGEPLVRKNILSFIRSLSRHLESGALEELTMTTNGSQMTRFGPELYDCGIRRVNISLDTLRPDRFKAIKPGRSGEHCRTAQERTGPLRRAPQRRTGGGGAAGRRSSARAGAGCEKAA